jgi:MPBQ/MSBQ methyltransferase
MARNRPQIRTNYGLRFYHEVLGLEHLHFGVWQAGEDLTYANLLQAQERYTDELLAWIPDGVVRVLDVGCGVGTTAQAMTERGYEVFGLTPDPYQRELFVERTQRPCLLSHFGHHPMDATYDLVLMSESCQYIGGRYLFEGVRRAAPGGTWLVADYFSTRDDGTRFTRTGHNLQRFETGLTEGGFEILRRQDITEAVLPTLEFVARLIDTRVVPALQLGHELAASKHPALLKLALWFFRREVNRMKARRDYVDVRNFRDKKRYMRYLIRVPGE